MELNTNEGNIDPFDDAFSEAIQEDDKGVGEKPKGEGTTTEVTNEKSASTTVDDGQVTTEEPQAKTTEEPPKSDVVPKEEFDKLAHQYSTLQGEFRKLNDIVKSIQADKGKEDSKPKDQPPTTKPVVADINAILDNAYDDLDSASKKVLKEYDEEFDIHSRAEDIKRKHVLSKVVGSLESKFQQQLEVALTEFAKSVQKYIEPIAESVSKTTESTHFQSIAKVHSDFETIRDSGELTTWIESQPKIIRAAYEKVCQEGSSEEVIEMLNQLKASKAGGKNGGKETTEEKEETTGTDSKEREEVTKTKISNLQQVKGKSTGVVLSTTGGTDDFDAAFDEAMSKVGGVGRR